MNHIHLEAQAAIVAASKAIDEIMAALDRIAADMVNTPEEAPVTAEEAAAPVEEALAPASEEPATAAAEEHAATEQTVHTSLSVPVCRPVWCLVASMPQPVSRPWSAPVVTRLSLLHQPRGGGTSKNNAVFSLFFSRKVVFLHPNSEASITKILYNHATKRDFRASEAGQ